MKKKEPSLFTGLKSTHVLRRSFEYLEQGNFAMAREVLDGVLGKRKSETNWFGDVNDCINGVLKDIVGCVYLLRKQCEKCNEIKDRRRDATVFSCPPYTGKHSKDIFGAFTERIELNEEDKRPKDNCVHANNGCLGSHTTTYRSIESRNGNRMVLVLGLGGDHEVKLEDIPISPSFDDKSFLLSALIGGNRIHFVGYIKQRDGWLFYDDGAADGIFVKSCSPEAIQTLVQQYPICNILYDEGKIEYDSVRGVLLFPVLSSRPPKEIITVVKDERVASHVTSRHGCDAMILRTCILIVAIKASSY